MKLLATLQRSGGIEGLARQVKQPVERVNPLCEGLLPPLMLAMRGYVRRNGGGMVGAQALLDVIDSRGDGALAADVLSDGEANAASGESLLSLYFFSALAGVIGSSKQKSTAVGPSSWASGTGRPLCSKARRSNVFFATVSSLSPLSRNEVRKALISLTDSPR